MPNDTVKNMFTISFDSWSTDGKTFDTQLEFQLDIGYAQNFNSPKYVIVVHQRADRRGVPNKTNSIAIFDNLNVLKYHVDIHGVR